jgi:hypothetical protein
VRTGEVDYFSVDAAPLLKKALPALSLCDDAEVNVRDGGKAPR